MADSFRTNPRQERARQTISLTLEAVAQILEGGDESKLTTNHVAEKAGFSIGTLYRYFSGKSSLLDAMVIAEMDKQEAQISAQLRACGGDRVDDFMRIVVQAALRPFGGRAKVRRALLVSMGQRRHIVVRFDAMLERLTAILVEMVAARASDVDRLPGEAARHILLRATVGAIRSAVVAKPDMLARPDFEDELVRMMKNVFKAGR